MRVLMVYWEAANLITGERVPILGKNSVVKAFLLNYVRHGLAEKVILATSPVSLDKRLFISDLLSRRSGLRMEVSVRNMAVLPQLIDWFQPHVIHHLGGPHVVPALAVARYYSGKRDATITSFLHTFSYPDLIHDRWSLLLGGSLPSDCIICPSHAAALVYENLLNIHAEELGRCHDNPVKPPGIRVIPYGVDTSRFRPIPKQQARSKTGLPPVGSLVGYLGRLSPWDKADLHPLLIAWARVVNMFPNSLLVIAGPDTSGYTDILSCQAGMLGIARSVRFVAPVPEELVPLLLSSLDVFVSPADNPQESFGLTPVEAMACGVPVIVSDWDGYRDTVREGIDGFRVRTKTLHSALTRVAPLALLVPTGLHHLLFAQTVLLDIEQLANCLELLLRREDLRAAMGEAARQHVETRFSWPVVIRQLEALWIELGNKGGQRPHLPSSSLGAVVRSLAREFMAYCGEPLSDMTVSATVHEKDIPWQIKRLLSLPYLRHLWPLLNERLAMDVLARTQRPTRVSALEDLLGDRDGRVALHVCWLLKHGLLVDVCDAEAGRP